MKGVATPQGLKISSVLQQLCYRGLHSIARKAKKRMQLVHDWSGTEPSCLPLMSQVAMVTLLDPAVLELQADESLELGDVFCNVNSIQH